MTTDVRSAQVRARLPISNTFLPLNIKFNCIQSYSTCDMYLLVFVSFMSVISA